MYGYGNGFCGGGEWLWIVIIIFIIFFICGNNFNGGCNCHRNNCQ